MVNGPIDKQALFCRGRIYGNRKIQTMENHLNHTYCIIMDAILNASMKMPVTWVIPGPPELIIIYFLSMTNYFCSTTKLQFLICKQGLGLRSLSFCFLLHWCLDPSLGFWDLVPNHASLEKLPTPLN